jgi:hypothetical protein
VSPRSKLYKVLQKDESSLLALAGKHIIGSEVDTENSCHDIGKAEDRFGHAVSKAAASSV